MNDHLALLDLAFDDFRTKEQRRQAKAKADFRASWKAEGNFARDLNKLARYCADLIKTLWDGTDTALYTITTMLDRYADNYVLPWAKSVVNRMHKDVASRDLLQWKLLSREMGTELRREIEHAPIGPVLQALLHDQIQIIANIPRTAAQKMRLHASKAVLEATSAETIEDLIAGRRSEGSLAEYITRLLQPVQPEEAFWVGGTPTQEMLESPVVRIMNEYVSDAQQHIRNHAKLIARTETARTASVLVEARAKYVGSPGYFWETAKDSRVRDTHKHLQGKFFTWDDPPECDKGIFAAPGRSFNCRCWPRVVLPE